MSKANKAMSPQRSKPSGPVQIGTQPDISKLKLHDQTPAVKPKQVNKAGRTLHAPGFEEFKPQSNFQFPQPSLKTEQKFEP